MWIAKTPGEAKRDPAKVESVRTLVDLTPTSANIARSLPRRVGVPYLCCGGVSVLLTPLLQELAPTRSYPSLKLWHRVSAKTERGAVGDFTWVSRHLNSWISQGFRYPLKTKLRQRYFGNVTNSNLFGIAASLPIGTSVSAGLPSPFAS